MTNDIPDGTPLTQADANEANATFSGLPVRAARLLAEVLATPTAEQHLERLQTMDADIQRVLAAYAHEAAHESKLQARQLALRWAIAELSRPLDISRALKLARDEGKRVRCREWQDDVFIVWTGKAFYKEYPSGLNFYVTNLHDCQAEWEVVKDA